MLIRKLLPLKKFPFLINFGQISTSVGLFRKDEPVSEKNNQKSFDQDEKKNSVDFKTENERRIEEILEYYSQYEKELAAGGYKDPEVEPWLETDDDKTKYSFDMTPGTKGVFDLNEIVEILRKEKARDVCSIEMPSEMSYADHLVVCTPMGSRHSNAICEKIYQLYKRKRSKNDRRTLNRAEKNTDWAVMDLGNIVVHVMTDAIRRRYDIEMLWAVGPSFDDLTVSKSSMDKMEENFNKFQEDLEWIKNVKTNR